MEVGSTWIEAKGKFTYPRLARNIKADIVIVGAGLAGILTAYLLSESGKKVVLLEKNKIGYGTTGFTTAFLTYVIDPNLVDLRDTFGDEKAKLIWDSHRKAIDLIEDIAESKKIECEFKRCSAYYFAKSEGDFEDLVSDKNLAKNYGFEIHSKKDNKLPFENNGYLEIANQAKFHPIKFLNGIAKVLEKNGVEIYENSEVIEAGRDKVKTTNGSAEIREAVIFDTYTPFESPTLEFQAKLFPYQSYVIEAETSGGNLEDALFWDTSEPYYYFRTDKVNSKTRLILGGLDHETGKKKPKDPYGDLVNYLRSLIPSLNFKIVKKWNAQVLETADGIAAIGQSLARHKQYFSTGFSGNGMTYSAISAQITADKILGRKNKYANIYLPQRFKKPKNILDMQVNYAKQMVGGYFGNKYKESGIANISKGSGKVIKLNGKKVAVFKDENGSLLKLSPICTHLMCIVDWNDTDKSWDCPCHGSRYTKEGRVINGPAKLPLKRLG